MLYPKVIAFSTFQIFLISFLISYYNIEIPLPELGLPVTFFHEAERDSKIVSTKKKSKPRASDDITGQSRLFTPKELAKYNGQGETGLYLALLGRVYDVEKGRKHYGPGGGYHFFAGRDASRAFVTGDFTSAGLIDDVIGLSHQDMLGIQDWVNFYENEYALVGYLQGTYYDSRKQPTQKLMAVRKAMQAAQKWRASQKAETERFPPCNSEWNQNKGGRVWCTNRSGGVTRDWVGVPRKLFKPGNGQSRCACVKNHGNAQSDDVPTSANDNRGDMDHPNLQEYTGCDPNAVSCSVPNS